MEGEASRNCGKEGFTPLQPTVRGGRSISSLGGEVVGGSIERNSDVKRGGGPSSSLWGNRYATLILPLDWNIAGGGPEVQASRKNLSLSKNDGHHRSSKKRC